MPNPRKSARRPLAALPLAVSVTAVYLVVGGAAGAFALHAKSAAPAPVPVTPTSAPELPRITTTPPPITSALAPTARPPTTTTGPPPGFHLVEAPGGLVTAVPEGWRVNTGTVATTLVATDPTNPRREVRLGGAPVTDPSKPLLDRITAAAVDREREPGHRRVTLAATTIRDHPAVDWEFDESAPSGPKRVTTVFWEANGIEYVLYSAGPPEEWDPTRSRLATMSALARP